MKARLPQPEGMIIRDWRGADPVALQASYEEEQQHWVSELGWDASANWTAVEQARVTWGLPGFIALDRSGRVRGWTFFLQDAGVLQIGGLSADSPRSTGALLDAIVNATSRYDADAISCFTCERAPSLERELTRRGFEVESFLYLSRTAGFEPPCAHPAAEQGLTADAWQRDDVVAASELLRVAYGERGRHFAPDLTPAAWERYVRNLVEQTACGVLNVEATRVVRGDAGMRGLVLVTAVGARTAHIAQVAVHPSVCRQGLAGSLVREACTRAAGEGFAAVTLLVGAANGPARALYEAQGFRERATFVAARKALRQSSAASPSRVVS